LGYYQLRNTIANLHFWSNEWKKLQGIKVCEAGIQTPGHGKKINRSNNLEFANKLPNFSKSSRIKKAWMAFFRLGGGFGDTAANGLFATIGLFLILTFLAPIQGIIKVAFILSCLLCIRMYRRAESDGLKLLFKDVLSGRDATIGWYK
jgi:hypothetical protein